MVNCTFRCCDRGLLLPIINESNWSDGFRAFLYLVGLLYSFLGIAIIADVFMVAIERITSKTYKVAIKNRASAENVSTDSEIQYKEVLVWNATVANLTLMALGSSAPEILLAIIEIVGNKFEAGKLGPGTIVGSAAYNLMFITAICIVSVPGGGGRRIEQIYVFITTAAFSAFAYLWLLIILLGFSPNEVEVWEGFFTLFWFAALTVAAWAIDRRVCWRFPPLSTRLRQDEKDDVALKDGAVTTPLQVDILGAARRHASERSRLHSEVYREMAMTYPNMNADELSTMVAAHIQANEPHSQLYYRIAATRWLDGRRRVLSLDENELTEAMGAKPVVGRPILETASSSTASITGTLRQLAQRTYIEFGALVYGISEGDKAVRLKVIRRGKTNKRIMFRYETTDGSAKKGEHYFAKSETMVFLPGETEKLVNIDLVENATWEDSSGFFVRLRLEDTIPKTKIGTCSPASVRYVAHKSAMPRFEFLHSNYSVVESQMVVRLQVHRQGNPDSEHIVQWATKDVSAHDGKDFEGGAGELKFENGEMQKFLDIVIIDDKTEEKAETFEVILSESSSGLEIGQRGIATVTIISDDATRELFMQLDHLVPHAFAKFAFDARSWKDQFFKASSINEGDTANATWKDLITHILAFPWKILCAFIPPARFCGGYFTFFAALGVIGLVTALVGDLATIFGCLVGLDDAITAITLVAMGTSLPDTFASRIAVQTDKTADNAIGNVTGSNSVNVFLGLGLPWFVAACYWHAKGKKFIVPAGSLGFSVTVYTVCSILCLVLLALRRKLPVFGKAELGGNKMLAWMSAAFLVFLWFMYILLSALEVVKIIPWPSPSLPSPS